MYMYVFIDCGLIKPIDCLLIADSYLLLVTNRKIPNHKIKKKESHIYIYIYEGGRMTVASEVA